MTKALKRNPLMPWYIGVAIIGLSDLVFLYYIMTHNCGIPNLIIIGLLVFLPALYLVLMYLALKSQD